MNYMWLWDLSIVIQETDMNVQMLDDQSLCFCVWFLQVKEGAEPGLLPLALNASVLLSWPGSGSGQSGSTLFGRRLS